MGYGAKDPSMILEVDIFLGAYTFDDEDIFVCHGYSVTQNGAAMLIQRPISWTADGWPELK